MTTTLDTEQQLKKPLARVFAEHRDLGYHGFVKGHKNPDPAPQFRLDTIRRAIAWLSFVAPDKGGSYRFKHLCEDHIGTYVSNGEIIAAAYLAGWEVTPDGNGSPNATLEKIAR